MGRNYSESLRGIRVQMKTKRPVLLVELTQPVCSLPSPKGFSYQERGEEERTLQYSDLPPGVMPDALMFQRAHATVGSHDPCF